MKNEPAVTVGAITAGVTALLTLAAAFGLDLSPEKTAAVIGVVAFLAPLVSAYFTRRKVTPFVEGD